MSISLCVESMGPITRPTVPVNGTMAENGLQQDSSIFIVKNCC